MSTKESDLLCFIVLNNDNGFSNRPVVFYLVGQLIE